MALIKCSECGYMISDKAVRCPQCGAPVEVKIQCTECGEFISGNFVDCPNCGCPLKNDKEKDVSKELINHTTVSSTKKEASENYLLICVKKYAKFSGRATQGEFWGFWIQYIVALLFLWFISRNDIVFMRGFATIFYIFLFIPSVAVSVRRLHDVNKSGWNMLWIFLPVVGIIILTIYWLQESDEDNQYGHSLIQ